MERVAGAPSSQYNDTICSIIVKRFVILYELPVSPYDLQVLRTETTIDSMANANRH
jgi:hypothetical protein